MEQEQEEKKYKLIDFDYIDVNPSSNVLKEITVTIGREMKWNK
jgi:hypothetical protein